MDILTYPTGLLIGLLPVVASLGDNPQPARLLLDSRPVCELTADAPSCLVDLGLDPRVHRLELVRKDSRGIVTESTERWINRPGIGAEVRATGDCDRTTRTCEFALQWAHPYRLEPREIVVSLDSQVIYRGPAPRAPVKSTFPRASLPQVVTVEAAFPDSRSATSTRLLRADNPERAGASLLAVPITLDGEAATEPDLGARLREAGWLLRAVEPTSPDVVFVIEPSALQAAPAILREMHLPGGRLNDLLRNVASVELLVADESLTRLDAFSGPRGRDGWLEALFFASYRSKSARRVRTADAVASAGYLLGAAPRPRAVVLIVSNRKPDTSAFSPEQARRYLSETLVPLVVWKVLSAGAGDWPDDRWLAADNDLSDALLGLAGKLAMQRVAWLERQGDADPLDLQPLAGISLAGRVFAGSPSGAEITGVGAPRPEAGVPARSIFAIKAHPGDPSRLYAGTEAGLFQSEDAGQAWRSVKMTEKVSVYGLAFTPGQEGLDLVLGTSGRVARRQQGDAWSFYPTAEILSVLADPFDAAILYAGCRSGVLKSTDGGSRWLDSSRGLSRIFALALAADPKRRETLYAATAGDGVYRSTDGAASWEPRGDELRKTVVRSLAVDPSDADRIYAGTDAGVFVSTNAGRKWSVAGEGVPRTPVYAFGIDPRRPAAVWAGTALGLYSSVDAGKTWKPSAFLRPIAVTSLAVEPSLNTLFVGTYGGGLERVPLEGTGRRD